MARTNIYTRDTIITNGLDLGGNPGLTTRAQAFLNYWLDEVYAAYDWSFLLREESITISGSTFDLSTLTDTFRSLKGVRLTEDAYDLEEWREGFVDMRIRLLEDAENSSTSKPYAFAVDPDTSNDQLYVYPNPDQSYSATIWYYHQPAVLSGDTAPLLPSGALCVSAVAAFAARFDGSNMQPILNDEVTKAVRHLRSNLHQSDQGQQVIPFDRNYHDWRKKR